MTIRYLGLERRDNNLVIYRSVTDKEGNAVIGGIVLKPEMLSIRAGEYGLDPEDDKEAVLDILLHDMFIEDDNVPELVTADTLEQARESKLTKCREKRDKFYARERATTREEDETHIEVLVALLENVQVDKQLALLTRDHTKEVMLARKAILKRETYSLKAQMIDKIREREGV